MSLWGWFRERLGLGEKASAEGGASELQSAAAPSSVTPAEPGTPKKSRKAKKPKPSKEERSRKRKARREAEAKAEAKANKKRKKRKGKGDPRLSGEEAPVGQDRTKRTGVQTGPLVAPVLAPPVFGEPEPEPPSEAATPSEPGPPESPAPLPEPAALEPQPVGDAEASSTPEERPARPPRRSDTLAWVVVPKLEALLASVDTLLADGEATRDALVAARKAFGRDWAGLRPVPREERQRLEAARDARMEALSARIDALPDPRAEEEAANVAVRTEIVVAAEALASEPDLDAALGKARTLQDIWRGAARVPREHHAVLQARWRAAMDAVYARRDAQRAERLEVQQGLVKRALLLAKSTDPIRAAEAMKGLQAQWKAAGHAGRSEAADEAWKAFRAAADTVFERRRTAKEAQEQENLASKEGLIAEVHALVGTEVSDVDEAVRRFHQRWRRIGHVPRADSDRVWASFRAACDRLTEPPDVDPAALGDGDGGLAFSPFAAALESVDQDAS